MTAMHPNFTGWGVEDAAELLELSDELYEKLWADLSPHGETETKTVADVWGCLTEAEQVELNQALVEMGGQLPWEAQ